MKKPTFNDFRRELPKRIADCLPTEKVQIAVSVDGLTAKALYSSIGDVSKYVNHCIQETVWREGGMLTVDGIVTVDELTIDKNRKTKYVPVSGYGDPEPPFVEAKKPTKDETEL